ncbi:cation:proton antiporter [Oceanicella actignis]|uniref:NhaP-type Na+/H+ or K+/H+ antiporter n=1 Tax=Oceanicella actignis TaxID=1189325 RepID=A0A1M7TRY9_9RHOB|nr:sodium:proton antiporter [Oceanicella actignis]TYO85425.1 sodium/proton antiporter (CPA1 family) [Oceanicella actignis]SET77332.1 sodium/proton antiporter, CPA1 family [Oceanicella actignis]SHN73501.1 NhaP-type Na+/H+ or K+/H+ antiporter [Oceanicella actignis]
MTDTTTAIALIGALGIGAQWLAWRFQLPAIVLMLLAGILAGPATGLVSPRAQFGPVIDAAVGAAVALILFEGGLTLNFNELRTARPAVRRLAALGAPLGWLTATLAAHWVAGLSWEVAAVFGGVLVVTGPTVVTPLLRQARLDPRPASILRWEAIVNDPLGALAAVLAFEIVAALAAAGGHAVPMALAHLALGVAIAGAAGWAAGKALAAAFRRGAAPEFLKAPAMIAAVLAVYAACDSLLHESGLLAVTVMGVVMGNARLPSLGELLRFKEAVTVLLVSGVFIVLAAGLDAPMIAALDWRAALFVLAVMFVARPAAVLASLIGTNLPWRERAMIAWIGPRGIVAVAISGFFGARLAELGVPDAHMLAPLAFALSAATVVAHGFSIGPAARLLGLTSTEPPGALIVGGSPWSAALAETLLKAGAPVLVADRNWSHLRHARVLGVPTYYGEILSEQAEHSLNLSRYGWLLATTDNDDYNALVCTDFAPEFGRRNVFQVGRSDEDEGERGLPVTLGGRPLGAGGDHAAYAERFARGWRFRRTALTEDYGFEDWRRDQPEAELIAVQGRSGALAFSGPDDPITPRPGAAIIFFGPPK